MSGCRCCWTAECVGCRCGEGAGTRGDEVGLGGPYVYALALGGVRSLVHLLRSYAAEADLLMAVDGYRDVAAVRENIRPTTRGNATRG